jgi:hypothetical protein
MKFTEIRDRGDTANSIAADTLLSVCVTPNTNPTSKVITGENFANSFNKPGTTNTLVLMTSSTPANAAIVCRGGTIFFDNNYIYVAIANNVVKRAALSSF